MLPGRLIENEYLAIKKWRHGLLMYNTNDNFIGRSIDIYGEWCDLELSLLGQFISLGDVVVDVGANIGTHTVFFSKAVGPKGLTIAFEPQRLAYQLLCANAALNVLRNVHCMHSAVGETQGSITVPVLDPSKEMNFGALGLGSHNRGEKVGVVTLDQFNLPQCKLIKIDVEGAETKVIEGAKQTIGKYKPALFVENNTVEHSASIIKSITDLGYKCWWHIAPYYNESNFFKNKENIFARFQPEANLLCFHSSNAPKINGLMPVEGAGDDWKKAVHRLNDMK